MELQTVYDVVSGRIRARTPLGISKLWGSEYVKFKDEIIDVVVMSLREYDAMPKSAKGAVECQMRRVRNQIIELEGQYSELNNLWVKSMVEKG